MPRRPAEVRGGSSRRRSRSGGRGPGRSGTKLLRAAYERDPLLAELRVLARGAEALQLRAEQVDELEVRPLVVSAEVVLLAGRPLLEDGQDPRAVVLDEEPVPDVSAVAVDRERLALQRVQEHERDQLFRELEGAVVVRAVRDQGRQAVRLPEGADEVVGRGLRGGVGRVRSVGRPLREGARRPERPVDLVGGDVKEAERAARRRVAFAGEMGPRGVQELERAVDVRPDEGPGFVDRAVDVALGGEIDHRGRRVLAEEGADRLAVGDVPLHERVPRVGGHVGKAVEVPRVGQLVEDDHPVAGPLERPSGRSCIR